MAQTITVLPEIVTAASGTSNDALTIDLDYFANFFQPVMTIEVTAGTFNFAVGQTAPSTAADYAVGDKLVVTLQNSPEVLKLNFVAASTSDKFKISM